ncbi:MAG: hypothetical protein IJ158_09085 [Treponema sp.]|nr:hypothetical protein [Treponema sp.]
MADMYPDNQELTMNGETVVYPGVDESGKFTDGDFNNPLKPPSFIPAKTINLLLDNMGGFIKRLGAKPNNHEENQLAAAFEQYVKDLREVKSRFVTFDFTDENHRSVKIAAGVRVRLDIATANGTETRWFETHETVHLNLDAGIQEAVARATTRTNHDEGRNFYGYIVPDFDTDDGVKIVVSCNSTYPNDISEQYTAANTRKLFSFHTLCANAGSNLQGKIAEAPSCGLQVGDKVLVKQYSSEDEDGFYDFYNVTVMGVKTGSKYDVVTVKHPLAGFLSGQILPESVFCIGFQPNSSPEGMVYDVDTDIAVDVYLQSGKGRNTASEFGGAVTNYREHQNHQDDMRHVRKRLLRDHEFSSIAAGSNETTNIKGSSNPVTTGGHIDTDERRMISFIGCEDCCGVFWQWLEETSADGDSDGSDWEIYDGQGDFGQNYYTVRALLAGALWDHSRLSGSRARDGFHARSTVNATFGGRGASHIKRAS